MICHHSQLGSKCWDCLDEKFQDLKDHMNTIQAGFNKILQGSARNQKWPEKSPVMDPTGNPRRANGH